MFGVIFNLTVAASFSLQNPGFDDDSDGDDDSDVDDDSDDGFTLISWMSICQAPQLTSLFAYTV